MKRFWALLTVLLILCTLVACEKDTTDKQNKPSANDHLSDSVELWNEEDFFLYNEEGELISNASRKEIYLSSTEGSMTKRGVSIGNDAIDALSRYDLCYGTSAYSCDGQIITLVAKSDLEELIKSGQETEVFVMFDEHYQSINVCEYVAAHQPEEPHAAITFKIFEGKIKDVGMILK